MSIKYCIQDTCKAGKGDAYRGDRVITLESTSTLADAVKYIKKNVSKTRGVCIEAWDLDNGTFLDECYTFSQAKKAT